MGCTPQHEGVKKLHCNRATTQPLRTPAQLTPTNPLIFAASSAVAGL